MGGGGRATLEVCGTCRIGVICRTLLDSACQGRPAGDRVHACTCVCVRALAHAAVAVVGERLLAVAKAQQVDGVHVVPRVRQRGDVVAPVVRRRAVAVHQQHHGLPLRRTHARAAATCRSPPCLPLTAHACMRAPCMGRTACACGGVLRVGVCAAGRRIRRPAASSAAG